MDRVSSLPNEVLCQILSNLTTKEAASTSVLSKRWRNLLAFVPYLFIDDAVFLHPEEGKRNRPEIVQSFVDFVDRVLALQGDNSTFKKFSLRCLSLTKVGSNRVDGWISTVLARGVSDLDLLAIMDIDEYDNDNYCLSPNSFESNTLVRLRIGCAIEIGWDAGSVSLPMLKTLVIHGARVEKFEILLHALPALEELVLASVLWKDVDVKVSSESLKTLTLNDNNMLGSLSIDTPSLVYFKYIGYLLPDYQVVNMKNLFEAQIIFLLPPEHIQRVREPDNEDLFVDDLGFDNVWKLFHGIRHVPYLYLSANTLEVMSLCYESMPIFNNLKTLFIKSDKDRGWQAMPVLLRNCPHLEVLVIEGLLHYETDKCGDACDCISREDKGVSLRSCPVKMLKIQGFQGTMKEMTMIKHFLDYFPCMKKMEIYIEENDPTEFRVPEVAKRISQMIEDYNKISSCNVQLLVNNRFWITVPNLSADFKSIPSKGMDIISNLPNDIICHIVSFLSAKEAVFASVLSKKWQNLFAIIPNLDFEDGTIENQKSLTDFLDEVLALPLSSRVKTFSLKCTKGVDPTQYAQVNRCLCNVLKRGVLELKLDINGYLLPSEVFICKTVVKLDLGAPFTIDLLPENVFLPAFISLVADSLNPYSVIQKLLPVCPLLAGANRAKIGRPNALVLKVDPILTGDFKEES